MEGDIGKWTQNVKVHFQHRLRHYNEQMSLVDPDIKKIRQSVTNLVLSSTSLFRPDNDSLYRLSLASTLPDSASLEL